MDIQTEDDAPLYQRLTKAPIPFDRTVAEERLADLLADVAEREDARIVTDLLERPDVRALLLGVLGCSPYLAGLIRRHPAMLARILVRPPCPRLGGIDASGVLAAATDAECAMSRSLSPVCGSLPS